MSFSQDGVTWAEIILPPETTKKKNKTKHTNDGQQAARPSAPRRRGKGRALRLSYLSAWKLSK